MSPALAGGFLTTAPPGKSLNLFLDVLLNLQLDLDPTKLLTGPWTLLLFCFFKFYFK